MTSYRIVSTNGDVGIVPEKVYQQKFVSKGKKSRKFSSPIFSIKMVYYVEVKLPNGEVREEERFRIISDTYSEELCKRPDFHDLSIPNPISNTAGDHRDLLY